VEALKRGDIMHKTILTVIAVIVVVLLLGLVVWNIYQGRPVKEIGMPGGGTVKFGDKKEPVPPSEIGLESEGKAEKSDVEKSINAASKQDRGKAKKGDISKPEVRVEQHTVGDQSPAVNAGRDATIIYEKK
jgi:hypothetical protein